MNEKGNGGAQRQAAEFKLRQTQMLREGN